MVVITIKEIVVVSIKVDVINQDVVECKDGVECNHAVECNEVGLITEEEEEMLVIIIIKIKVECLHVVVITKV